MAFAPSSRYYNIGDGSIVGMFREKECDNLFEYTMAADYEEYPVPNGKVVEFPHEIWVTEPWKHDRGFRRGLVKKTVAYIVIDEDENGPVVEKWYLKDNNVYENGEGMLTAGQQLIQRLVF
jgi:hypothetical protein